ncbi:MAG TPA: DJ-1/PfpI family protein [Cyclobacteriaceae bacterium]|nr:DJ-1/PfpI family protein [Cyclobacteriaceae bacterium]
MKQKTCYLFVFDGFADYETSLAAVGIRRSGEYQLKTIAIKKEMVRSMSGMAIMPDVDFMPDTDLADIDNDNTGMLILPGGTAWEAGKNEAITPLVAHCLLHGIPVAGICGATVFLAELGLLNRTVHTSNAMEYLTACSRVYRGQALYRATPSVKTEFLITASGTAATEFAHDIFESLGIIESAGVNQWFQYFQREVA